MNEQDIRNLIAFMKRVQLSGSEVPVYVDLVNKLSDILRGDEEDDKVSN